MQEVLEIPVKPGWKDGTRITYGGMGDELPGKPPQARPVRRIALHAPL